MPKTREWFHAAYDRFLRGGDMAEFISQGAQWRLHTDTHAGISLLAFGVSRWFDADSMTTEVIDAGNGRMRVFSWGKTRDDRSVMVATLVSFDDRGKITQGETSIVVDSAEESGSAT